MNFAHPEILLGVFALPLLVLFFWWAQKRKRRLLERFGRWSAVARLIETTSTGKQVAKMALLVAAVGLLIVALARPQYGSSERTLTRRGIDLMVAIDVSNSMLARDIGPEGVVDRKMRIERAREQLSELIMNSRGHRIGIIAYAGAAFVQCPLTLDYGLALEILDVIDVGIIPLQGTNIGLAINTAVDAFERADSGDRKPRGEQEVSDRVLLLLTDGEDHDQKALQAAVERAAKAGIKIFAIGMGSSHGQTIEIGGRLKKDEEGHNVQTKLDRETLDRITFPTGGKTILGSESGGRELIELRDHLNALNEAVKRSTTKTIYEERFVPVLALVFLLLIWEFLKGDRRKPETAEKDSSATTEPMEGAS